MKYYVLYNPYAGSGNGKQEAEAFGASAQGDAEYFDVTQIIDYDAFFKNAEKEAEIVVCGGDGTVNRFLNEINGLEIEQKISYYACGSGNDFLRDVGEENSKLVSLDEYRKNLPTVTVKGKDYVFINGVGYGIDGYCCEVGDKARAASDKPVNYTAIAIKGLLFHYKPTNATVCVDGKEYSFKKVWIAPTMKGRFYGGGMMPTPNQTRESGEVSLMVFHDTGKLKTLMIFPSIFKGEHVKKEKYVTVFTGKEITVKFDEPRPLQIDGETILDVSEYTVKA